MRRMSLGGDGGGPHTTFGGGATETVNAPLYAGWGSAVLLAFASVNRVRSAACSAPGCAGSLRIPSSMYAAYRRVSHRDFAASTSAHFTSLTDESGQPRAIASWIASAITSPGTPPSVPSRYPFAQVAIE